MPLTGSICLFAIVLRANTNYFHTWDAESQTFTAVKVPRQCPLFLLVEIKMKRDLKLGFANKNRSRPHNTNWLATYLTHPTAIVVLQ